MQCQAKTASGNQCKRNALSSSSYCGVHSKSFLKKIGFDDSISHGHDTNGVNSAQILETTLAPDLSTTIAMTTNTMARYRKNPSCPKCNAHPTICQMRRGEYSKHRCRECGYRFEIGGG